MQKFQIKGLAAETPSDTDVLAMLAAGDGSLRWSLDRVLLLDINSCLGLGEWWSGSLMSS